MRLLGTFDHNDIENLRVMYVHRCEVDRWSDETRRCLASSATWDEGIACESKMTKEQLDLLEQDIKGMGLMMGRQKPTL